MGNFSEDYYDEYLKTLDFENSSSVNFTADYFGPHRPETGYPGISIFVYSVIFLIGVPGNAAVIWIIGFKLKRTAGNIWFLNLAVADLLCCLALPFFITNHAMGLHWPFGPFACTVIPSLTLLNAYASVLILTMISIDRCILVMWPIWCQNKRTLPKACVACVAVWSLALLLTSPSFIFRHHDDHNGNTICEIKYSVAGRHALFLEKFISVFRFVLAFLIPFLVITVCNSLILAKVRRSRYHSSNKTLKVILAVVVGFFMCWFPHQVVALILALNPRNSSLYEQAYQVHSFVAGLAYANSCINPVIYVLMGQDFKEKFKNSIRKGLMHVLADDYSQIKTTDGRVKAKTHGGEEKSTDSAAL